MMAQESIIVEGKVPWFTQNLEWNLWGFAEKFMNVLVGKEQG